MKDDELQTEAEPMGMAWRIIALVVLGIVVVAIVVMAWGLLTH